MQGCAFDYGSAELNRFKVGDTLEVLSESENFGKKIVVEPMKNEKGEVVEDARRVQEILYLPTNLNLKKDDILRMEKEK